jgi:signal transduction histidine kinase
MSQDEMASALVTTSSLSPDNHFQSTGASRSGKFLYLNNAEKIACLKCNCQIDHQIPEYYKEILNKALSDNENIGLGNNIKEEPYIFNVIPIEGTDSSGTHEPNTPLRKESEEVLKNNRTLIEELVVESTKELKASILKSAHVDKFSALGRLTASMAHEFNNPIYGVRNVIEALKEENLDAELKSKLIFLALKECDQMAESVRRMQNSYQSSPGQFGPTNIHKTINEVILAGGKQAKERGIRFVNDFEPGIPLISLNEDQIKQVLLNFIQNAEEAIPDSQSEPTILISTNYKNHLLQISIKDTGVGISKDRTESIFEPFQSTKPTLHGVGFGLPVSYGIIKSHGGTISVNSKIKKGTTFTISIPNLRNYPNV